MFPFLSLRILYFPCYFEVSLDFILEHIFSKKEKKNRFPEIFQSILCRMDKYTFFLSAGLLLFYVITILTRHFVLFFSILSQEEKFYVKRKNNI